MRTAAFSLVVGSALAVAPALVAQSLTPGSWTGTMALASGPQVVMIYRVTATGDSVTLTMQAVNGPEIPASIMELEKDRLIFTWGAEPLTTCRLQRRKDGSYAGKCTNPDGPVGDIAMIPPPTEDAAPEELGEDVLTTEDLLATRASNAYDAIQRLRPQWLRARGPARLGRVAVVRVFVDNQPVGGVDFLRSLDPNAVREVRLFSASEASMRWGGNVEGGVIHVSRRRG